MAPYSGYNNYYDPVDSSSSNQPQQYTYAQSSSTAQYSSQAPSSYQSTSNYQGYRAAPNTQQYDSNARQNTSTPTTHSASALGGLPKQTHSQSVAGGRANNAATQYDPSSWDGQSYGTSTYAQMPNRSQATASPLYASNSASTATFGRLSAPDQSQTQSPTFQGSQSYQATSTDRQNHQSAQQNTSYQSLYPQTRPSAQPRAQSQSQQPPRYASPLHAVQAAQNQSQGHKKQASREPAYPSPQMAAHNLAHSHQSQNRREHGNSVDHTQTTVNPSQVYDDRAERQRLAQIDAARRAKAEEARAAREAEEAAQKAEEERIEAERKEAERKEAEEKEVEKQRAESESRQAAQKAKQDKKNEQRPKAREEKRKSTTAATALQQMASSGVPVPAGSESAQTPDDEESEMRAMFRKMREFNSRNPAMLAQMWEEERKAHASQSTTPQQTNPPAPPPHPAVTTPSTKVQSASTTNDPIKTLSAAVRPPAKAAALGQPGQAAMWPTHKRGNVAETATKWLNAQKENQAAGKIVNVLWIMKLLDRNPSYVQLCESIEKLGLTFERSAFAKELLKVIPDGARAQSQQSSLSGPSTAKAASPKGTPQANTTKKRGRPHKESPSAGLNVVQYQTPNLSDVARAINAMDTDVTTVASAIPRQLANTRTSETPVPSSEIKPEASRPSEPPPPPADKEEAARKRTFGDLVDLTLEDSDDEGPPRKANVPPYQRPENDFNQPGRHPNGFQMAPQGTMNRQSGYGLPPNQQTGVFMTLKQPIAQPPGPPQPKPTSAEQLQLERQQQERMRGRMLVEPIMRDRVARKSTYDPKTIARDVLLATGRHPDMRALNAHLSGMQKLLSDHGGQIEGGGNKSDLSTIRWDLIDPGEPSEDAKAKIQKRSAHQESEAQDADDEEDGGTATARPAARDKSWKHRLQKNSALASTSPGPQTVNNPDASGPPRKVKSAQAATPHSNMTSPAVGYAAFRAAGDGQKKKGRPVGWRKALHSREALGLTPAKQHHKATVKPSDKIVEPEFQIFKCQWDGCKAELHNLDILKKHVVKLHGKPNEENVYECLWANCEDRSRGVHVDRKGRERDLSAEEATFDTIECWMDHTNKQHVQKLAWELGDGPKSDNAPHDSDAYLSDAQGRSVTPIIAPPAPANGPNVGDGLHLASKNEKQAADELAKLAERKKLEGVIFGREGSRLATAKRRLGFLDAEDFEDEIEESD